MALLNIKETVQQVADAITASIELETEIVDQDLMIVGGTGRYKKKIGTFEEEGNLNSDNVYATCITQGKEYINFHSLNDEYYDAKEGELAEICCPIKAEDTVLGLIGLIALTESQRELLIKKSSELISFLRIMSELIAGKYIVSQNNIALQKTVSSLLSTGDNFASFENIVGKSEAMQTLKKRAKIVSQSNSTILITGESGTGKSLLASSIHKESPRKDMPFISVNCAAIPETLLESELFGYEKGAFTGADKNGKLGKFQLADKGTIFLDEIGDMPMHLQVKLLTCLQNRKIDPIGSSKPVDVDVRIIAATNKDLEKLVRENQFREDLYFRLNVIPLNIPPLRERPEDIAIMINHTINKYSSLLQKEINGIDKNALNILLSYSWPGNIREIENVIEYAINMEASNIISISSLPDKLVKGKDIYLTNEKTSLKSQLNIAERAIINNCLDVTGCSLEGKRKAADILEISESTLYRKLRILGIKR